MTIDKYIGLPYKDNGRDTSGIDCWGLARLYYSQELNIDLPSYSTEYNGDTSENIKELISQNKENWTKTEVPEVGDLVLFNIYGEPTHIGICVGDNNFLHSRDGKDSVIESLSSQQWDKRIAGFYKYSKKALIQSVSMPHPLRTVVQHDWTVAGTTIQQFAEFIKEKYKVSERLFSKIVILVDGVPVKPEHWETTVLQPGQSLAYRAVPGKEAGRMILMVVVAIVAFQTGLNFAGVETFAELAAAETATQFKFAAAMTATNLAGMALTNAIFPIRTPTQNNPGNGTQLNLFNGSSNQANRFGAIPVVLGKIRMAGMLGATPYIESQPSTTLLNLLLVWGYGPLHISDEQVGATSLKDYYTGFVQEMPFPVHLAGYSTDNPTDFNKLYSKDVEQEITNVELVYDTVTKPALVPPNPWKVVSFNTPDITKIDVALTFPEGMRQIIAKGSKAGEVQEAIAQVELQYRKVGGTWNSVPNFMNGSTDTNTTSAYTDTLPAATYSTTTIAGGDNSFSGSVVNLYRWYTIAVGAGGLVHTFAGAATESQNAEPSAELIANNQDSTYSQLLGFADSYTRLPEVPSSFIKLYSVCVYGTTGYVTHIDHRGNSSNYTGFNFSYTNETAPYLDAPNTSYPTGAVKIMISTGYYTSSQTANTGVDNTVFTTLGQSGVAGANTWGGWNQFLIDNGVWNTGDTGDTFDKTFTFTIATDGYYKVQACADDMVDVIINSNPIISMPFPAYNDVASKTIQLDAGTNTIRIIGKNTTGKKAVAVTVTYNSDGFLNSAASPSTILTFGTNGFYSKEKNAFNFVYSFKNLAPAQYEVRVRRVNDSNPEPSDELRNYFKVLLFSVTGFSNTQPAIDPPGCRIAKSAIRLQSSSKANGTIEGINALLQTIAYDWDGTNWTMRATNNPASLFLYVLSHPANAYRVEVANANSSIDLAKFQEWHSFCVSKNLTYNSVVTNTQSVMDVLRDIAAAGKASPSFVDGKWSIVIDKPRSYPVQHFTPHNSWGFESTKILPKIPDGFRISFPNEAKAYQPDEIIVYKEGISSANATIFEELRLPGVTNKAQAEYFGKWHYAQLKLRPETYTFNTDFEYLVCTRGDWVKVAHDVPLWGTGTGRIVSISNGGLTLKLSESISMLTTADGGPTTYAIRIRTNALSNNSILKNLAPITTSGYTDTITLASSVSNDGVLADNLFMLGELGKETQDLIVIAVEPTGNTSARLTLVDYSPQIYSENFTNLVYDANISGDSVKAGTNPILYAPIITGMTSDNTMNEQITKGNYQNTLLVSFANPSKLSQYATKVELQIVLSTAEFSDNTSTDSYIVNKESGSITIKNLSTGKSYKIRVRYTNADGTLTGPWSDTEFVVANGRGTNNSGINSMTAKRSTRFLNIAPYLAIKPNDFKYFEARVFKDPGTGDFWDNTSTDIKKVTFTGTTTVDLKEFPTPRISDSPGTQYRIACRIVDNAGNYSTNSLVLTVLITKIAP
jgi:hypothetical protein